MLWILILHQMKGLQIFSESMMTPTLFFFLRGSFGCVEFVTVSYNLLELLFPVLGGTCHCNSDQIVLNKYIILEIMDMLTIILLIYEIRRYFYLSISIYFINIL